MLHITDDQPRRSLKLQWKGLPQHLFRNLLIIGITAPFGIGLLALSLYSIYSVIFGDAPWTALFMNLFVLPFLAIIVAVYVGIDRWTRTLTFLSVSAETGSLHWRESGVLISIDIVVPLSGVRELRFDIGPESNAEMPIQITLGYSQSKNSGRSARTVRVKSVNMRMEAMDLLFRIARIL